MTTATRPPLSALLEYLLSLGPDDREPGYDEAWDAEIRRRIREIDEGTAVMVDGEAVVTQLRTQVAGVGSVHVSG